MFRRLPTAIGLVLITLLAPVGCSHNPVTGENSLLLLSKDTEIQMGTEAEPQFIAQFGGKVPNQQLQEYVSRVGHTIAAVTEEDFPSFPWEFNLLNSDVINAFALPGGKVFITRGLAAKLTSEAQLAGVLGHEVGHVTARHSNQQISQGQLLGLGVGAVEAGVGLAGTGSTLSKIGQIGVPALKIGSNVYLLRYSRKDESQADALGMRYMSRCGYNPAAQRQVMEILQREAGAGQTPEWLSTHPYPETRIEQINKLLATTYQGTQNNPQYKDNTAEYQSGFLSVLATLPPAPPPPKTDTSGAQGLQPTHGRSGRSR